MMVIDNFNRFHAYPLPAGDHPIPQLPDDDEDNGNDSFEEDIAADSKNYDKKIKDHSTSQRSGKRKQPSEYNYMSNTEPMHDELSGSLQFKEGVDSSISFNDFTVKNNQSNTNQILDSMEKQKQLLSQVRTLANAERNKILLSEAAVSSTTNGEQQQFQLNRSNSSNSAIANNLYANSPIVAPSLPNSQGQDASLQSFPGTESASNRPRIDSFFRVASEASAANVPYLQNADDQIKDELFWFLED